MHTANRQRSATPWALFWLLFSFPRCFPKRRLEKDLGGKLIGILGDVLIEVTSASCDERLKAWDFEICGWHGKHKKLYDEYCAYIDINPKAYTHQIWNNKVCVYIYILYVSCTYANTVIILRICDGGGASLDCIHCEFWKRIPTIPTRSILNLMSNENHDVL